jgi:allantoicase
MIEVDTSYFIGNAPGAVRVTVADEAVSELDDADSWWDVLPKTPVLVDTRHRFLIETRRPATHLRLDVYPDGGLTRCVASVSCRGGAQGPVRAVLGRVARRTPAVPDRHRQRPADRAPG